MENNNFNKTKLDYVDTHLLYGQDYWLKNNKPQLAHSNFKICNNRYTFIVPFPSCEDNSYIYENKLVLKKAIENKNVIPVFAFNPLNIKNIEFIKSIEKNISVFGIIIWPILCNINLNKLLTNSAFCELLHSQEGNEHFFVEIHTGAGNEKDIGRVDKLNKYLPLDLINIAKSFPKNKFILTHALRLSIPALIEAKKLDNVMIETSGISSNKNWFENNKNVFPSYDAGYLSEIDPKSIVKCLCFDFELSNKLIFGSGYPFSCWWGYDIQDEINLIINSGLSKCEIKNILKENIFEFLKLKEVTK